MRVLFTSIPGYGHICPLIPLAKAIDARGHQVAFATSESLTNDLHRAGVPLLRSGPDWHESQFGVHETDEPGVQGYGTTLVNYIENLVNPQMLRDVDAHVRNWKPDVILSNDYEWTGRTIAEDHGIPFVLASSGPRLSSLFRTQWQGPMAHKMAAHRKSGLPIDPEYALKWLRLSFAPPSYCFGTGEVGGYEEAPNEFGIQPQIYDDCFDAPLPLDDWSSDGKPTVLCTLGSVFNKNQELLRLIVGGLREHVGRLLVQLGPGMSGADLHSLSPKVQCFNGVALSRLVPKVDYCITHGGTSTLMTMLAHGMPTLLLPQGADQTINALACKQNGLAVVRMGRHPLGRPNVGIKLTAEMVSDAFLELVSSPTYRVNVERFRDQLSRLPSLAFAVGLMERLAESRMPITR